MKNCKFSVKKPVLGIYPSVFNREVVCERGLIRNIPTSDKEIVDKVFCEFCISGSCAHPKVEIKNKNKVLDDYKNDLMANQEILRQDKDEYYKDFLENNTKSLSFVLNMMIRPEPDFAYRHPLHKSLIGFVYSYIDRVCQEFNYDQERINNIFYKELYIIIYEYCDVFGYSFNEDSISKKYPNCILELK